MQLFETQRDGDSEPLATSALMLFPISGQGLRLGLLAVSSTMKQNFLYRILVMIHH